MDELIEKDIEEIKRSLLEFEDKIKNNTFLITGGAGFLGSWLCDVVNAFGGKIIVNPTVCVLAQGINIRAQW